MPTFVEQSGFSMRLAEVSDLQDLMALLSDCISNMNANGLDQWEIFRCFEKNLR